MADAPANTLGLRAIVMVQLGSDDHVQVAAAAPGYCVLFED